MGRKKKPSRKYIPDNRFAINNSPSAMGHPDYVFGITRSGKYKSFGLTTEKNDPNKKFELKVNPNSKDTRISYIKKDTRTTQSRYMKFPDDMRDWEFDKSDMPLVRHLKKDYKKKCKRHKKKK